MAVKSKTALPEVPADENTLALAAAAASKQAFAAAQELAITRQSDLDNAELASAEMEGQFNQGDASATASDWSIVQAEVTRSEMLSNAAQAAEKRAGNAVINTDVTLALLVQPFVQSALKGVEVIPSFYVPKTSPDKAVAYVIQRVPTGNLGGGSVAGKVEVRYFRPDLYRAIDPGDIQSAAKQAHCEVMAASSGHQPYGDNMKLDVVQIDVKRGQTPVPLIPTDPTSGMATSRVAHAFGADLAVACKSTTDPAVTATSGVYRGVSLAVTPTSGKVTNDVDDDGVRTSQVHLELTYQRQGTRMVNVQTHLNALLTDWEGSFVSDFGTVTSATGSVGFPDPMPQPTTPVTVDLVFVSRIR